MSELSGPVVLVTGASGFIGTHLCRMLVRQGGNVRALTRGSIERVEGVDYRIGDLRDDEFVHASLEGVDCVIHLAGRAHVLDKKDDALSLYRETNHDLTLHLARHALNCGVRRFIFLSSIGVNGKVTTGKRFTEAFAPDPCADYAVSKSEAEGSLQDFLLSEKMDWVIIRPPLVYGADAPGNFKKLLKAVYSGIPSPFSWVDNARSIISIENLIRFIALAIKHPEASREIFLVSDGTDISTHEMLAALSLGMRRKCISIPLPRSALRLASVLLGKQELYIQLCGSLTIDCSKARELGYKPDSDTYGALIEIGRQYAVARRR